MLVSICCKTPYIPGAQLGSFAAGVIVYRDDNTITNTAGASITVGHDASGITVQIGDRNTISNAGTITVGDFGSGIFIFAGNSSTVTNSGRIIGGDNARGIATFGDSNTIINTSTGIITVGSGFSATGIDARSFGAGPVNITNAGTINVGADGIGIFVGTSGTVFNSGTINAATGVAAIEFCGCGPNVLTLGPGSVINGLVMGAGTDTFQLGEGCG